jgi:hypothetical protein
MEGERNETYERIPWEMLERKGKDRQWGMFVVAGAIVVGALAYSFVSNRAPATTVTTIAIATRPTPTEGAPVLPIEPTGTTVASPVVVSEADLFAVDPERVLDEAVSHAEWFVAEWFTVDGSKTSSDVLGSLMPVGVPLAKTASGVSVFVEWVKAISVEEMEPFRYRVEVLVRYLVASADEPYVRRPPLNVIVEVTSDESGPHVALPPVIETVDIGDSFDPGLVEVPVEVGAAALEASAGSEVIGGLARSDGSWSVVVIAPGPDGISRPQTVEIP